jgi:hypothetical protein
MQTVTFWENNSGGSYWLSPEQYQALAEAGWRVDGKNAEKEFNSLKEGKEEWENLTGENSETLGCECCGRPYQFY